MRGDDKFGASGVLLSQLRFEGAFLGLAYVAALHSPNNLSSKRVSTGLTM